MPKFSGMATLRQTTAFGPGVYRGHSFTKERLRSFVEGTNKAIAAGIAIPLLKKHARINASDRETEQFAKEDGQGVGWVTRLDIGDDGGLVWEAKDVPSETAGEIQQGTLKLTSPEFRNHYTSEKEGVYSGPIVRHIAFTPLPGNPHQGPIVQTDGSTLSSIALEETQDAWQFAEEEREPLPEQFAEHDFSKHSDDQLVKHHDKVLRKIHKAFAGGTKFGVDMPTLHSVHPELHAEYMAVRNEGRKRYKANPSKYSSQHSETPFTDQEATEIEIPAKETGTTADQYSEDSWTLPFADYLEWERNEATEQFAHRDPVDKPLASELMAVHSTKEKLPESKMAFGAHVHSMDMGRHQLHQQHEAIVKNLDRKKAKGVYDHEKAKKLWGYYAKSLSDHYAKHHGGGKANPATRHHVASMLADDHHNSTQHSEQFSEDHHKILTKHGWKKSADHGGGVYEKDGHAIHLGGPDSVLPDTFTHSHGKKSKSYHKKSLEKYLTSGAQFAEVTEEVIEQPLPDINPDMPPKTPDRNKLAAILAGLAQKNIVVPSDFDFTKEGALDILLGCINSAIKAENETKAEMQPTDPESEPVTEAAMPFAEMINTGGGKLAANHRAILSGHGWKKSGKSGTPGFSMYSHSDKPGVHIAFNSKTGEWDHASGMGRVGSGKGLQSLHDHLKTYHKVSQHSETQTQSGDYMLQFTEEEIAAMPPSLKAKLDAEVAAQKKAREDAEAKAAQFAEEKQQQLNSTAKEKAVSAVKAASIPPAMKKELIDGYSNIQFAEGAEVPTYTAEQVAGIFARFIPKHLQFNEEDVVTSPPPKGKRQTGTDGKGMPVYAEDAHGEQFFEDGDVPTGHVSAERARELVNSNPVLQAQQRMQNRKPTTGEDIARMNANQREGFGN